MKRFINFFILALIIATLTTCGIANWAYPKGEAYWTGEYQEINDGQQVIPEIEHEASPLTNPAWVRFMQDNFNTLFVITIAVLVGLLVFNRNYFAKVFS